MQLVQACPGLLIASECSKKLPIDPERQGYLGTSASLESTLKLLIANHKQQLLATRKHPCTNFTVPKNLRRRLSTIVTCGTLCPRRRHNPHRPIMNTAPIRRPLGCLKMVLRHSRQQNRSFRLSKAQLPKEVPPAPKTPAPGFCRSSSPTFTRTMTQRG